jgi:hypothetical protein
MRGMPFDRHEPVPWMNNTKTLKGADLGWCPNYPPMRCGVRKTFEPQGQTLAEY